MARNRSIQPAAFALLLLLAGCDDSSAATESPDVFGYAQREPTEEQDPEQDWNCTDDCSGHEAGYEWAASRGITHPNECVGNSDSFNEGCATYAEENREPDEDPYDDGEVGLY